MPEYKGALFRGGFDQFFRDLVCITRAPVCTAEGSEVDILGGIREDHWPLIRQIVAEIHAGEGIAAQITKILEARGFQTALEEEAGLSGSGVVKCYAVRPHGTIQEFEDRFSTEVKPAKPATQPVGVSWVKGLPT